jgi:hypothetical protein
VPQLSSWLPGVDAAVAQDSFWGYHRLVLLRLAAKFSHVGMMWSCFYQSEFIRYQSSHGNYVCGCGGVALSGGDGTYFSTQVPAIRCAWAHVVMSCCTRL